ncbi:MAG: trehalose-phosphatase [Angustibacter sp.]
MSESREQTTARYPAAKLAPALLAAVREVAGRHPLLVALDFDGVLAPIVDTPSAAQALPGSMDTVRRLAGRPGVTVALVSGRSRVDLLAVSGLAVPDQAAADGSVLAVGSHGAELDVNAPAGAAPPLLRDVRAALAAVAARHPGARVEDKPTAAVLHTRGVPDRADAATAAREARAALAALPQAIRVHVTPGKEVVEAAVVPATKGAAVQRLRSRLGDRCAVVFVGDDVTDETVFATLRAGDVGIKVGPGDTTAAYRIADPTAVRSLLSTLETQLDAQLGTDEHP